MRVQRLLLALLVAIRVLLGGDVRLNPPALPTASTPCHSLRQAVITDTDCRRGYSLAVIPPSLIDVIEKYFRLKGVV